MFICTVQQSESAIHTHISPLFWISFPFRSPWRIEFLVLYTMFWLVIYFIHSSNSINMSIPISQSIPPPPCPLGIHVCSLHLSPYFCFVNKMNYTNFFRLHIQFSFWVTPLCVTVLCPSMFLQMIQFQSFLWLSNIPLYICTIFIHSSVDDIWVVSWLL